MTHRPTLEAVRLYALVALTLTGIAVAFLIVTARPSAAPSCTAFDPTCATPYEEEP